MAAEVFQQVIQLAAARGIILFCDEVYRELEHDPASRLPAACELYDRAVSLGSMSKTYGLPGLRLGWLASKDADILERCLEFLAPCFPGSALAVTLLAGLRPAAGPTTRV